MNQEQLLYQELKAQLKTSTGTQRTAWARYIVEHNINLKALTPLLQEEEKTAMRMAWLLSDVGLCDKEKLFDVLPCLFSIRTTCVAPGFEQQFAKYWRIAGIPEEDKGLAIDYMFQWLVAPEESTHIKTVSLEVLYQVTKEYPELKNELQLCLEQQPEDIDVSLKKAIKKVQALSQKNRAEP
ncbi:MAG: hypothetical protein R2800_04010 [Flavipsychrobacter sp.]